MKKFLINVVLMMVILNAVIFLGSCVAGRSFEFTLALNLIAPVLCALVTLEEAAKRAKLL